MLDDWRPSADISKIRQRAQVLQKIRQFFCQRNVLEVDTPAMSHSTVTDIHLDTFETHFIGPGYASGRKLFFATSPEFHMKRLLAAGSGCIYQLSKAFRNEESGRFHNPEFTLLEWYRVGFDHHKLMDEMADLLQLILQCKTPSRMTYQTAFIDTLGVCPLSDPMDKLKSVAYDLGLEDIARDEEDRDTLLQLLFSIGVETKIGHSDPVFVYDFPASQAALAKISQVDKRVAERFEVYFKGIELANGFHELEDPREQLQRFERDNLKRVARGEESQPIDRHLIAALESGLPSCSGVALGVDRLVMLATASDHIDQILAFPFSRA
ncbi:elongation factor P--(R)-beta-lysine ligase [Vibrio caribbeanicus]|uniref:Lysyl-tRNA synthetase n=1 Tax=Vibrio caribbeanicus ATCC BAA-2122 TaxID=796620 RepID=E3BIM8_9VIBR|nr:elongation factor P--(R)-beta-lysine ligase [Vibrio caribbeanicus]EFP97065.1 lysyl-tRNA synthetase [Vibrio caribbeanicus ATCC BAA-2122]